MTKLLKIGDEVTMIFNTQDICVTPGMHKYNKKKGIISKVIRTKPKIGSSLPNQYQLHGVVSDYDIPYTFTRDMLYLEGE